MKFKSWLPYFTVIYLTTETSSEIYTAIAHMQPLVNTQQYLTNVLRHYLTKMDNNLIKLKHYAAKMELEHKQASRGIQDYLSNPLNAYLMTKRLTKDWWNVKELITNQTGHEVVEMVRENRVNDIHLFPTEEDLLGTATGILRLQHIYNLKTSDLTKGIINGVQLRDRLSSSDCYQISNQSYMSEQYNLSTLWMKEALHRYHEEVNKTIALSDIFEALAFNFYIEGNPRVALEITNKLLKMEHNHTSVVAHRALFKEALRNSTETSNECNCYENHNGRKKDCMYFVIGNNIPISEWSEYQKLCSGEVSLSEKKKSQLKCRYVDFGRPHLKLGKLKEEEAYLNPRIVVYHDVLYDREINALQNLSIPNLSVAGFATMGIAQIGGYRSAKVTFLSERIHPKLQVLDRRTEDITGLSRRTSEDLQVVNYGVGGHYGPHCDFGGFDMDKGPDGDRIATVLFYLNDVAYGGATVFTKLNVTVYPRKGSALVWYNLLKDGKGDYLTRHASCPVLLGSKWICTKWFHERDQEFIRPCDLTEDDT